MADCGELLRGSRRCWRSRRGDSNRRPAAGAARRALRPSSRDTCRRGSSNWRQFQRGTPVQNTVRLAPRPARRPGRPCSIRPARRNRAASRRRRPDEIADAANLIPRGPGPRVVKRRRDEATLSIAATARLEQHIRAIFLHQRDQAGAGAWRLEVAGTPEILTRFGGVPRDRDPLVERRVRVDSRRPPSRGRTRRSWCGPTSGMRPCVLPRRRDPKIQDWHRDGGHPPARTQHRCEQCDPHGHVGEIEPPRAPRRRSIEGIPTADARAVPRSPRSPGPTRGPSDSAEARRAACRKTWHAEPAKN